ncbi:MAG: hypothetical protein ACTSQI_12360 [Candidatus Helarchaeota archaeon]
MPRVSRLLLRNIGHPLARFHDLLVDFEKGMDSLIWLDHGGGKTALLELFFSVILPSKKDFMAREAHKRALEDFVQESDVGHVSIEWIFDEETPPIYFLTGMVVEWRNNKLVKLFYGMNYPLNFDLNKHLTIENLPYQEKDSLLSIADIVGTLKEYKRQNPDQQVQYIREPIRNWEEYLRKSRIDPEVFRYQLVMNEKEGRVDEFFKFKSEITFLKDIINIIQDDRRIQKQFEFLKHYTENIKKIPNQELELEFIQEIIPLLEQSSLFASNKKAAIAKLNQIYRDLKFLKNELEGEIIKKEDEEEECTRKRNDLAGHLEKMQKGLDLKDYELCYFRDRFFKIRIDEFNKQMRKLEDALKDLEKKSLILDNLPRHLEIQELKNAIKILKEELSADIKPIEDDLKIWGSIYHEILLQTIETKKAEIKSMDDKLTNLKNREIDLNVKINTKTLENERETENIGKLENFIENINNFRLNLINRGIIEAGGDIDQVTTNLQKEIKIIALTCENLNTDVVNFKERQTIIQKTVDVLKDKKTTLLLKQTQLESNLDNCKRDWQDLMSFKPIQERILFDNEIPAEINYRMLSPANRMKLNEQMNTAQSDIKQFEYQHQELQDMIKFYREHKEFPLDKNIITVYHFLKKKKYNVHFGWKYLRENYNLQESEILAKRIPHLLNGLILVGSSLDLLRGELRNEEGVKGLNLSEPVLVSSSKVFDRAEDGVENMLNTLVIDAGLEWRYKEDSISKYYKNLCLDAEELGEKITELHITHNSLQRCLDHWDQFLKKYPEEKHKKQRSDLLDTTNEIEQCQTQIQDEKNEADELERKVSEKERELKQKQEALEKMQADLKDLEEYAKVILEAQKKIEKQKQLEKTIHENKILIQEWIAEIPDLESQSKKVDGEKSKLNTQIANYSRDLSGITLKDGNVYDVTQIPLSDAKSQYNLLNDRYTGILIESDLGREVRLKENQIKKLTESHAIALQGVHLTIQDMDTYQKSTGSIVMEDIPNKKANLIERIKTITKNIRDIQIAVKNQNDKKMRNKEKLNESKKIYGDMTFEEIYDIDQLEELIKELEAEKDKLEIKIDANQTEYDNLTAQLEDLGRLLNTYKNYKEKIEGKFESVQFDIDEDAVGALSPRVTSDLDLIELTMDDLDRSIKNAKNELEEARKHIEKNIHEVKLAADKEAYRDLTTELIINLRAFDERILLDVKDRLLNPVERRKINLRDELEESKKYLNNFKEVISTEVVNALNNIKKLNNVRVNIKEMPYLDGQQYLKIDTRPVDSTLVESTVHEYLMEKIEKGAFELTISSGLGLLSDIIIEYVSAGKLTIKLLHPPQHNEVRYVKVSDFFKKSGSEKTTMTIYLYCMLVQYRHRIQAPAYKKHSSHVLVLDNSIGQSSKVEHVKMQLDNANKMHIQLIYATGVKEVEAYKPFLNIIPLCNECIDNRDNNIVTTREYASNITGGNIYRLPQAE